MYLICYHFGYAPETLGYNYLIQTQKKQGYLTSPKTRNSFHGIDLKLNQFMCFEPTKLDYLYQNI